MCRLSRGGVSMGFSTVNSLSKLLTSSALRYTHSNLNHRITTTFPFLYLSPSPLFNTSYNHQLLLQWLQKHCCLQGSFLQWMTSYLAGRTQKVLYSGSSLEAQRVCYGILQESVLRLLLFNLYTASLSNVISAHGLNLHQYADDCQLYQFQLTMRHQQT